jgi:hypothetical protein
VNRLGRLAEYGIDRLSGLLEGAELLARLAGESDELAYAESDAEKPRSCEEVLRRQGRLQLVPERASLSLRTVEILMEPRQVAPDCNGRICDNYDLDCAPISGSGS